MGGQTSKELGDGKALHEGYTRVLGEQVTKVEDGRCPGVVLTFKVVVGDDTKDTGVP